MNSLKGSIYFIYIPLGSFCVLIILGFKGLTAILCLSDEIWFCLNIVAGWANTVHFPSGATYNFERIVRPIGIIFSSILSYFPNGRRYFLSLYLSINPFSFFQWAVCRAAAAGPVKRRPQSACHRPPCRVTRSARHSTGIPAPASVHRGTPHVRSSRIRSRRIRHHILEVSYFIILGIFPGHLERPEDSGCYRAHCSS